MTTSEERATAWRRDGTSEPHRPDERRALALCAHPEPTKSRFSRPFFEGLDDRVFKKKSLAEDYPDWLFDVRREQHDLKAAHSVVVIFPIYWYSPPAILQKWIEDVFVDRDDFDQRTALAEQRVRFVVSTGGSLAEYGATRKNRYDVETFLRPLEMSFRYAGADVDTPVVAYASWGLCDEDVRKLSARFNAEHAT